MVKDSQSQKKRGRKMGTSDIIEQFLREIIESDGAVEIQRKTIAERFGCVPSQINYVIRTRFTNERGFSVESKRGGGGYLRIRKVGIEGNNVVMHIINSIGDSISFETASVFVRNMIDNNYLTAREGRLILSAITDNVLTLTRPMRDSLRASILKNMLVGLAI